MVIEAKIPCTVWPGWFSDERCIKIDVPGAENVIAFVNQRDTFVAGELCNLSGVDGYCRVYVIDADISSVVIDLPQPSLTRGTRFKVDREYVTSIGEE